jgi:hypothetical protein
MDGNDTKRTLHCTIDTVLYGEANASRVRARQTWAQWVTEAFELKLAAPQVTATGARPLTCGGSAVEAEVTEPEAPAAARAAEGAIVHHTDDAITGNGCATSDEQSDLADILRELAPAPSS